MFFALYGYRIWLFIFYASIMTVLMQAAVSSCLAPIGMPTLTFPFTVISWISLLVAGSKDLIAVKLSAVTIPEDHYRRIPLFRWIKSRCSSIDHLTKLFPSENEDVTWETLVKLETVFIPILMCSYASENDINGLKMLAKKKANFHSYDHNSRSPLHIGACLGNMTLCQWLIENVKVDINVIDRFGSTPLYDAFWHGHFHLLPWLYSYVEL